MPGQATLLAFTIAALALVMLPGPSVVYVMTRGVQYGRGAGLVSVVGLELGSLVHLLATVGGLAALLAAHPEALEVLRWAGVAYLLWLGVSQLRRRPANAAGGPADLSRPSRLRLLRDGLLIDLLNPGTALFFVAFLPQFVDPNGNVAGQILVLGACYLALAIVNDTIYALVAGHLGQRLTSGRVVGRKVDVAAGVIYLGLAGVALLI